MVVYGLKIYLCGNNNSTVQKTVDIHPVKTGISVHFLDFLATYQDLIMVRSCDDYHFIREFMPIGRCSTIDDLQKCIYVRVTKSELLTNIMNIYKEKGGDIEEIYYSILKKCIFNDYSAQHKVSKVKELNVQLDFLKQKLIEYLSDMVPLMKVISLKVFFLCIYSIISLCCSEFFTSSNHHETKKKTIILDICSFVLYLCQLKNKTD